VASQRFTRRDSASFALHRAMTKWYVNGEFFTRSDSPSHSMLYLIGVNHILQHESTRRNLSKLVRDKRAVFKAHVLHAIENFDIAILAEEFSKDAKKLWRVNESTLEQFGKTKGIKHRFCDPTSAERKEKGIEESDWEKRVEIWLSQIQDCKNKNVLFVCGDDHFEFFRQKLIGEGFDVKDGPRWDVTQDEWRIIAVEISDAS
jgi:hypothetical protein